MFDLLSMAELTASAAIVVFFLSSALSETPRQRAIIAAALAALFAGVLTAAANQIFSQPGIGTAGLGLGVIMPLVLLAALGLGTGRGRDAIRRTTMASLIGVHAVRVLGILFVLLYATKRLPAPFAPVAGWGDVAIGITAVPLALLTTGERRVPKRTDFCLERARSHRSAGRRHPGRGVRTGTIAGLSGWTEFGNHDRPAVASDSRFFGPIARVCASLHFLQAANSRS